MMMKKLSIIVLLSGWAIYANAGANEDSKPPVQVRQPSQTEAWLELQRQGNQASLNKQYLSGPAMENIHKRYLESFTRPIPERFDPGQFSRQ